MRTEGGDVGRGSRRGTEGGDEGEVTAREERG